MPVDQIALAYAGADMVGYVSEDDMEEAKAKLAKFVFEGGRANVGIETVLVLSIPRSAPAKRRNEIHGWACDVCVERLNASQLPKKPLDFESGLPSAGCISVRNPILHRYGRFHTRADFTQRSVAFSPEMVNLPYHTTAFSRTLTQRA